MMNLLKIVVAALFLTSYVSAFFFIGNVNFDRAMWVWSYDASISTPMEREELLRFCEEHDINLIFLGTEYRLDRHADDYAEFIEAAHGREIRVFALAGRPEWALAEHHEEALSHVRQVTAYNAAYPWAAFDGIQLDIEPYTMPDFYTKRKQIGEQLLQLLEIAKQDLNAADESLELNAAIPFWYATGRSAVVMSYNGSEKPLSHHMLDIVDSVSIMAYRDDGGEQIRVAEADLHYASQAGKKAYIGAETKPPEGDSIPKFVTYHDKRIDDMHRHLRRVERHFQHHPGFAGIAVHHYESYKHMAERDR